MSFKRKTQFLFLINLIFIISVFAILTGIFTSSILDGKLIESVGLSFGIIFISMLFLNTLIIFILSKNKNTLFKSIIPILISSLIYAFILSFTIGYYDNWSHNHIANEYNLIELIGPIIFSIFILLLIFFGNIYHSIFTILPITNNKYEEWEVINFFNLTLKGFSIKYIDNEYVILFSKTKQFLIKIKEENDRQIVFEHTKDKYITNEDGEQILKKIKIENSEPVNYAFKIQNNLYKKTNYKLKFIYIYLDNIFPNIIGEKLDNIYFIQNNKLFNFITNEQDQENLLDLSMKGKK